MTDERHQPIDITTLALENLAPSRDAEPFHPEVDIADSDWGEIIKAYEEKKEKIMARQIDAILFSNTACYASAITVLSPQRIPLLGPEPTPCQLMMETLTDDENTLFEGWRIYPVIPAYIKIGAGGTAKPWSFVEDNWPEMCASRNRLLENDAWDPWEGQIFSLAILAPSKINELDVDNKEWEKHLVEMWVQNKNQLKIDNLASIAIFKLFHPQKTHLFPANTETWQKVRQELQDYRELKDWNKFCGLAIFASILATSEAKITERGIELVMPERAEPFQQEVPSMPPMRRF